MKIDDRVSGYMAILNRDPVKAVVTSSRNNEPQGAVRASAFNVQLSIAASRQTDDTTRLEKLSSVKKQLAEGTYNISGRDVADKILKVIKG
jgi:anti-sigma28 factor (negative regulator of flagellin synthesis)